MRGHDAHIPVLGRGPGAVAFPWALLERSEDHSCCWPTDRPLAQLEMQCFFIPWWFYTQSLRHSQPHPPTACTSIKHGV